MKLSAQQINSDASLAQNVFHIHGYVTMTLIATMLRTRNIVQVNNVKSMKNALYIFRYRECFNSLIILKSKYIILIRRKTHRRFILSCPIFDDGHNMCFIWGEIHLIKKGLPTFTANDDTTNNGKQIEHSTLEGHIRHSLVNGIFTIVMIAYFMVVVNRWLYII